MKVTCVSATLRLSPKKEDEVIQYSFVQYESVQGKPGDVCFDGAFRVHVSPDDKKQFKVGDVYFFNEVYR
jgi:hypothetical protein